MYSFAVYLPLLLSASALLIAVFSFFHFKSYLKRRTGQERILSELREEVNNILLSINETTDRDISLIEEREKNLKSLLQEIDKRLKVYIREMESRQSSALQSSAALHSSAATQTYEALSKNRFRATAASPPEEPPAVSEQIRSLVKAGFSAPVIASRLGISITEVEFAAALLERREG